MERLPEASSICITWHFPRPSIVSELMMPAATVCGLMRLFPAKALARHDRVNLIDDACGNSHCSMHLIPVMARQSLGRVNLIEDACGNSLCFVLFLFEVYFFGLFGDGWQICMILVRN